MPDHKVAAQLTNRFYVSYDVERYILRKRKGCADPEVVTVGGYRHRPSLNVARVGRGRGSPAALPIG